MLLDTVVDNVILFGSESLNVMQVLLMGSNQLTFI